LIFWLDIISVVKEIAGNAVGVNDGSGIDVKVADGTGVFVGTSVPIFSTITVGVGVGMNVEHPTMTVTLKIVTKNMKDLCVGFDNVLFSILVI